MIRSPRRHQTPDSGSLPICIIRRRRSVLAQLALAGPPRPAPPEHPRRSNHEDLPARLLDALPASPPQGRGVGKRARFRDALIVMSVSGGRRGSEVVVHSQPRSGFWPPVALLQPFARRPEVDPSGALHRFAGVLNEPRRAAAGTDHAALPVERVRHQIQLPLPPENPSQHGNPGAHCECREAVTRRALCGVRRADPESAYIGPLEVCPIPRLDPSFESYSIFSRHRLVCAS